MDDIKMIKRRATCSPHPNVVISWKLNICKKEKNKKNKEIMFSPLDVGTAKYVVRENVSCNVSSHGIVERQVASIRFHSLNDRVTFWPVLSVEQHVCNKWKKLLITFATTVGWLGSTDDERSESRIMQPSLVPFDH